MPVIIRKQQDPMAALRASRKDQVNANFNAVAQTHVALAHAQKRQWAETNDERLKPEAELRGLSVEELAALILSKPDDFAERELDRQRIMLLIGAAKNPEELNAVKGAL